MQFKFGDRACMEAAQLIDSLKQAFDARKLFRLDGPNGTVHNIDRSPPGATMFTGTSLADRVSPGHGVGHRRLRPDAGYRSQWTTVRTISDRMAFMGGIHPCKTTCDGYGTMCRDGCAAEWCP